MCYIIYSIYYLFRLNFNDFWLVQLLYHYNILNMVLWHKWRGYYGCDMVNYRTPWCNYHLFTETEGNSVFVDPRPPLRGHKTHCFPEVRDTVPTNRQTEKLNFDTNYITMLFMRCKNSCKKGKQWKIRASWNPPPPPPPPPSNGPHLS
jgi:hypothetical protein